MPVDVDVDPPRLKAALRDFIALSAIPAMSVGREPEEVAAGLADSLVEVLQLDAAFVRMSGPDGVTTIEVTRGGAGATFREWADNLGGGGSSHASQEVVLDLGDPSTPCRGVAVPIGMNGKAGLVVAASARGDFPTAIDRVLLSLAANHAAIAFENARLIQERDRAEEELRRAHDKLEARVVERTAELNVANEELSALRRVAELVARGAQPREVIRAVSDEVGYLFDTGFTGVVRFEPDGRALLLGGADRTEEYLELADYLASAEGFRTRRSARADASRWESEEGEPAERLRSLGITSTVASPIVVDGELWGAVVVGAEGLLPPDTEERLEKFTDIVATAIANTQARTEIERLVDEQAALRRVATLVARGALPMEVFGAVAEEVGRLHSVDRAYMTRFDSDDAVTVMAFWSATGETAPVELPRQYPAGPMSAAVRETRRPVRLEPYSDPAAGAIEAGLRSSVAAPITVEGSLWGFVSAASTNPDRPPAAETETRLSNFSELVATAIANAESRESLAALADEQAALRRVATLVAQAVPPSELFEAVTHAVGMLLDADLAVLHVFPGDGMATAIASWSDDGPILPVGTRFPLDGDNLAARIFKSGAPARLYSDDEAWKRAETDLARSLGMRSAVGAPILVEGKLWGALMAATCGVEPWAENAETRLAAFTELVATAIANTEARGALAKLVEEQATLRRMATLVAQGLPPDDIFAAVSEEAGRLIGSDTAAVVRFEHDPPAIVVVGVGQSVPGIPIGTRSELDDGLASAEVYRTGRSARIDARDWASVGGPLHEPGRRVGLSSTVASPISVGGRLWGTLSVSATAPLPLDTEERLEKFTELVATAIANAENRSELAASRARIVTASDDARRRIERDLHDGVQQQLVTLSLELGALKADPPTGDALKEQLAGVTEDVGSALDALVDIARGIHPAILSQGGLAAALGALVRRSSMPVELEAQIDGPLPDEIEVAAYYVVSEALTNVAKYARASRVRVHVTTDDGTLTLVVRDDGVGGAKLGKGSGLVGLQDRVEALGGAFAIESPVGEGTRIAVALPIATKPDQDIGNVLGSRYS